MMDEMTGGGHRALHPRLIEVSGRGLGQNNAGASTGLGRRRPGAYVLDADFYTEAAIATQTTNVCRQPSQHPASPPLSAVPSR
jgi:hypothetical protein